MKQLSDSDIQNMIGGDTNMPAIDTMREIRAGLHTKRRIPENAPAPEHTSIDFHNHTEQEAWDMLAHVATSGTRSATVITGASGILKPKFQQWVRDSIISKYFISCTPINNGSFAVRFKKNANQD